MSRGTACCSDHTPAAVSGRPREGESRSTGELVLLKSNLQLLAMKLQAIDNILYTIGGQRSFCGKGSRARISNEFTIRTRSLNFVRAGNQRRKVLQTSGEQIESKGEGSFEHPTEPQAIRATITQGHMQTTRDWGTWGTSTFSTPMCSTINCLYLSPYLFLALVPTRQRTPRATYLDPSPS